MSSSSRLRPSLVAAISLFERPHHQRIARVLSALNGPMLRANRCWFAGGTALALRFGEFRESVDIDFCVSDVAGYRTLRELLAGAGGIKPILGPGGMVRQVRELRADQYGLRTMLDVDGFEIKFEIIREARIELDDPDEDSGICGVATLGRLDMAATKLLANSDRWADDGTFSRDVIDLAMMRPGRALLNKSTMKAEVAYGSSVDADLTRAIEQLGRREGRLERCISALGMTVPLALLWQRLRAIRPR